MTTLDLLVTRAKAAGALRVYKVGAVPSSPGDAYMVLGVDTGTPISLRTGGVATGRRYRLTVQMFAKSEAGLADVAYYADEAFDEVDLTELDGDPYCRREMAPPLGPIRDPDGEVLLYALHTYRF